MKESLWIRSLRLEPPWISPISNPMYEGRLPPRHVTDLALVLLAPQTRERYTLLEEFRVSGFEEKSEEEQDFIMCELLFEVRANGDMSLQEGRDLVAALQKRYLHRRKFTSTSWLLRAWQSLQPATQAAPMPENVCYAIFVLLVVLGFEGEGLALLLAFVGLMRISEVVNLEISDVHFLVGEGGAENLVLVLRKSKRGIPMGEKVVLTNMVVLACVRDFLLRKKQLGRKVACFAR